MTTALVILNRNDVSGLKFLYDKIPFKLLDECIVVDGQSKDGSIEFCKAQGLTFYIQEKLGRGSASRYAAQNVKSDNIIFFSSDGNEDPEDIPKFINMFNDGYDMVIASRNTDKSVYKEKGNLIPHRFIALKLFTSLVNIIWNGNLTDVWNGYRGFNRKKLILLNTTADGFLIEAQQSIRALKKNYKMGEFSTNEMNRISGESQNPIFITGLRHIILLIKEIWIGSKF